MKLNQSEAWSAFKYKSGTSTFFPERKGNALKRNFRFVYSSFFIYADFDLLLSLLIFFNGQMNKIVNMKERKRGREKQTPPYLLVANEELRITHECLKVRVRYVGVV